MLAKNKPGKRWAGARHKGEIADLASNGVSRRLAAALGVVLVVLLGISVSGCAGRTPPLMKAIERQDDATFHSLLMADTDHAYWFEKKKYGLFRCPLHYAASLGRVGYVEALMDVGVDVNQPCWAETSALWHAVFPYRERTADNYVVTRTLLEAGAEIDSATAALEHVTSPGLLQIYWEPHLTPRLVALWLDYGAELDLPRMVFHAAHLGDLEMVRVLVEGGADLSVKDDQGRTAYQVAADANQTDVMFYLADLD